MSETESLKTVLSSIFRRRGAETEKTKLFDNLPQQVQAGLKVDASFIADEAGVLASVLSADHWVLITTHRVVFKRMGRLSVIDCSQLKDATVALGLDAASGIRRKSDLTSLKLILKSGEEQVVEVESGPPHIGIWNVLKHFGARNARS
jgi:hypothetical protein